MKRMVAALAVAGSTVLMGGATVGAYPPDGSTTVPAATTTVLPGGTLPATGSGPDGMVWIAGALLVVGGGMFAASQARRKQTPAS